MKDLERDLAMRAPEWAPAMRVLVPAMKVPAMRVPAMRVPDRAMKVRVTRVLVRI
jgi:hypothetical protein